MIAAERHDGGEPNMLSNVMIPKCKVPMYD